MIYDTLREDMKGAMKQGDTKKVETLRMALAAVANFEIEKKGKGQTTPLSDEEVLGVLKKEVKKRKDAIALYVQGGRDDLVASESGELTVLEAYLPAEMPKPEVMKLVREAIEAVKPSGPKDFGRIMGEVMRRGGSAVNPSLASECIKETLGS